MTARQSILLALCRRRLLFGRALFAACRREALKRAAGRMIRAVERFASR